MPDDINSILGISPDPPPQSEGAPGACTKYFLWIDEKQDGPYEPEQIREMLDKGGISGSTLCHPENGSGGWTPISYVQDIVRSLKHPVPPTPKAALAPGLPPILNSRVAGVLTLFAVLEFIGAVFGGFVATAGTGDNSNPGLGGSIFVCGILSGVLFLGFARVVENSFQSAQRLQRIEALIQKRLNDKASAP